MADIELWAKTQDGYGKVNPHFFQVNPDKKYVFGFSGNGNTKEETTTGLIGFIGRMVGLKNDDLVGSQKDFELMAVRYEPDEVSGVGKLTERQHRQFANNVLMPFFTDENFKRFPIDEAIKNANKITFFSYCAGSVEISKIIARFKETMLMASYQQNEIDEILSNIWHISYAPQIIKDNDKKETLNYGLRTFRFMGLSDALFASSYQNILGKEINGIEIREAKDFDGVEIFFSKLLNTASAVNPNVNDHHLSTLMKDLNWKNPDFNDIEDGICVKKSAPVRNVISDIMGYVTAVGMIRDVNNNQTNDSLVEKFNEIKSDYSDIELKTI